MAADSSNSVHRRRVSKPLIEKRRRARINSCLAQLKDMVAKQTSTFQETRASRLEKADILEMTVEYVRKINSENNIGPKPKEELHHQLDLGNSFEEGYKLCMSEVNKFFSHNICKQASKEYLNSSLQKYLKDRCDVKTSNKRNASKPSLPSTTREIFSSNSSDEYSNEILCEEEVKVRRDVVTNTKGCLSSYSFKNKLFVTNGDNIEADKIDDQTSSEIMWRPW